MELFTTRPQLEGTFGAVASTHWLASAAGMAILERGGNAFDAAVSAGFVLQVVEPHMNGPAGEVPVLIYSELEKRVRVLCGQGVAPQAATSEYFRDLGLDLVPATGLLPSVVPGAFDAWMVLLRDYGTMKLEEVIAIAVGYATNGVPLTPAVCSTIADVSPLFIAEWKTSGSVYLPGGSIPRPGRLFRNEKLGDTWLKILSEAQAAGSDRIDQIEAARAFWSRGFVAEAIDNFCRCEAVLDSTGERHQGILVGEDMAAWQATWEEPQKFDYHGYTLFKTGPWGQGPVMLQQLALLKNHDLEGMDPVGASLIHLLVETAKLAFADREAWYGDPNFVDVPIDTLLSERYNAHRNLLIDDFASLALRPGSPGLDPKLPHLQGANTIIQPNAGVGEPTLARLGEVAGDTCHLDVIDCQGNMVTATPSGGWLQSSPVLPQLGFPLGTRGQMFWVEEGYPNSIAPGKRPRTTLTPSFAARDGEPYMAFGTPGGDQQDQWQLTFFLRHVHYGMNLQEAIDMPSFHTEHFPSSFYPRAAAPGKLVVEGRIANETVDELIRKGHLVERASDWSEGRLSAVTKQDEILRAAANPRGMQGYAIAR